MITHEQACELRVGAAEVVPSEDLTRKGYVLDCGYGNYATTKDGERALAAYDAHYTTIETAELQRLQQKAGQTDTYIARLLNIVHDAVTGDIKDLSQVNESAQFVVDDIVNLRRELERLRALERKIGIFLEHMTSGNAIDDPLEFGGVRIEWVKSGDDYGFWFVTKVNIGGEDEPHVFGGIDYYFSALRKAFELFVVSGEEV